MSREKTYTRKIKEALLAFRLERELTKAQILELYLNKIFLGHRAYGFQAASYFYYDKPLDELNLAQFAMLAGLPKAPSSINPVSNPHRAINRRNYVLRRMLELERIAESDYEIARSAEVTAKRHGMDIELEAPYLAEMARDYMVSRFGEEAYASGYRVYTTVSAKNQEVRIKRSLRDLMTYDRRHGFAARRVTSTRLIIQAEDQRSINAGDLPHHSGRPSGDGDSPRGRRHRTLHSGGTIVTDVASGLALDPKSPSQFLHPGDVDLRHRRRIQPRLSGIPTFKAPSSP